MSFMPSVAYVAEALHSVGAETTWEEASPEEQKTHLQLAHAVLETIWVWQQKHKPDGSDRYYREPMKDKDDTMTGWALHDRIVGSSTVLGVIHDPLLAQQIIEALNREKTQKGPIYGD